MYANYVELESPMLLTRKRYILFVLAHVVAECQFIFPILVFGIGLGFRTDRAMSR